MKVELACEKQQQASDCKCANVIKNSGWNSKFSMCDFLGVVAEILSDAALTPAEVLWKGCLSQGEAARQ